MFIKPSTVDYSDGSIKLERIGFGVLPVATSSLQLHREASLIRRVSLLFPTTVCRTRQKMPSLLHSNDQWYRLLAWSHKHTSNRKDLYLYFVSKSMYLSSSTFVTQRIDASQIIVVVVVVADMRRESKRQLISLTTSLKSKIILRTTMNMFTIYLLLCLLLDLNQ